MRSVASLLVFAASALALSVISPNNSTGWSTAGNNTVSWSAVSTDPTNFTVVLVNENEYPPYSQVLDALVDTSLGTISVGPPSAGWVVGDGYQVNLVKDANDLASILAQSNDFTLTKSNTSSSSSASPSGSTYTATNSAPTGASTDGSAATGSSASGSLNPTNTVAPNGAAPAMGMQAALLSALALLGVALA